MFYNLPTKQSTRHDCVVENCFCVSLRNAIVGRRSVTCFAKREYNVNLIGSKNVKFKKFKLLADRDLEAWQPHTKIWKLKIKSTILG